MQITAITPVIARFGSRPRVLVKVETDEGITGWGEGTGSLSPEDIAAFGGADALNIEGALAIIHQAGIGTGPASGIEMALWDLQGKAAGLPVHTLLGGRVRDRAQFTACMGIKEPEESAQTARIYFERATSLNPALATDVQKVLLPSEP